MPTDHLTPRDWAAHMLGAGAACILDTETTDLDGAIIELAVIDAATGATLIETLVDPGSVPIHPEAHAVHGITAAQLVDAPTWPEVHARLSEITAGRVILAYNAEFDRARILDDCQRAGIGAGRLAEAASWQCVMARRVAAAGLPAGQRLRLDGGHRALADVHATRAVLQLLADGRPDPAAQCG